MIEATSGSSKATLLGRRSAFYLDLYSVLLRPYPPDRCVSKSLRHCRYMLYW